MSHTSKEPSDNAKWSLTESAFDRLLGWLDEGASSDGEAYIRMRRRLITFFDRKGFTNSVDLADETLNRVARRLEEEGTIEAEAPAKYCYIVARFVFHEALRSKTAKEVSLEDLPTNQGELAYADSDGIKAGEREYTLACLDHCVGLLSPDQRALIVRYYFGEKRIKIENRRRLAEESGVSVNALSIRAFRIRAKLEGCLNECLGRKERE